MLNIEAIQDLCALGFDQQLGINSPKYEDWIIKLFEEYDIDESDKLILSVLLKNLESRFMADQEKDAVFDKRQISMLRKMSISELIYHYTCSWEMKKFIDIQPMSQPVGLIYYKKYIEDSNGGSISIEHDPVSALTRKSKSGVDGLFQSIQDELINHIYTNISEPDEIGISDLRAYLDRQPYNKVIYDSSLHLDPNSFTPMISNGAVIRMFEDFNKEVIDVKNCIRQDELLLKKQSSKVDIGVCFAPYMLPMRAMSNKGVLAGNHVMGRYGIWSVSNINEYFKRVKVVIDR